MKTSVITSIIIRMRMVHSAEILSQLLTMISKIGGQVGAIEYFNRNSLVCGLIYLTICN